MSFVSFKERDLNSFLLGTAQTSSKLGPGSYDTTKDFPELKKKTQSRKAPAFLDGIAPGKETVALGSNYYNFSYTPGPGKYNAEGHNSPFYQEIIKNDNQNQTFFVQSNGGKLTRRTQWFSADKTQRFASDDRQTSQFVHQSVGPGQYSPRTTLGEKFEVRRFSEMSPIELKTTLSKLNDKIKGKTLTFNASKTMHSLSPPKIKNHLVPKLTSVASIPHRTKGAPYVEQQKRLQEELDQKVENKYQARPPAVVHPYNPNVSPLSYEPKVNSSKPAESTKCSDVFGKSGTIRKLKWEQEMENRDYQSDKPIRFKGNVSVTGNSNSNFDLNSHIPKAGPSATEYFKQKKLRKQQYEGKMKKKDSSNEMMPDHHQAQLNKSINEKKPNNLQQATSNQDIQHVPGGFMQQALAVNAAVHLLATDDSNLSPKSTDADKKKETLETMGNKKESIIKHVEFFGDKKEDEIISPSRNGSVKKILKPSKQASYENYEATFNRQLDTSFILGQINSGKHATDSPSKHSRVDSSGLEAQNISRAQNDSFQKYKRAIFRSKAELAGVDEKKYMNVDFFDWLQNKQLQTGLLMQDQQEVHKKIVQQYRKQPGPGEYNHSHYSDFFSSVSGTKQNFFGTERGQNYPNHLKAPGIGDSVGEYVGPATYRPEGYLSEVQMLQKKEIFKRTAVEQWHKRMFDEEREKDPKKYPQFKTKQPSPGPGEYVKQDFKMKTFQKPHTNAFGVNELKKVSTIDKVQLPTVDVPGPGTYLEDKFTKRKQYNTSNMMSKTTKILNGQHLHASNYPSATQYNTANFNTIEHPIVTGGAPNNVLALKKYEMAKTQKALNPFQTNDLSHEKKVIEQNSNMGPGKYSPEQMGKTFGGSEFERSRQNMFSTVSATKASYFQESSRSALNPIEKSIFGSSSARFQSQNRNDQAQKGMPGPGTYYGFGAGNFNPGQKEANNVPINDSRALDDQWNNKSHSTKFSGVINHQMALSNMNLEAVLKGKIKESDIKTDKKVSGRMMTKQALNAMSSGNHIIIHQEEE